MCQIRRPPRNRTPAPRLRGPASVTARTAQVTFRLGEQPPAQVPIANSMSRYAMA